MRLSRREKGQSAARGCQIEFDENGPVSDITAPQEVVGAEQAKRSWPGRLSSSAGCSLPGPVPAVRGPVNDGRVETWILLSTVTLTRSAGTG